MTHPTMTPPPPTLVQRFQAALGLHQAGRMADAQREYQQILSADPNFAPAWHMLGIALFQANQPTKAIEHIQRAIDLGLNGADVFNNLGEVLRANNRFDEAIPAYQRAIERNPEAAGVYANLGTACNESRRFAEAIPPLQKSLSLRPDDVNTMYQYAVALWHVGQSDQVIDILEKAIALAPDVRPIEIAELLATAYYLRRDPKKSLQTIDRALSQHPTHPVLHRHRAIVLFSLGQYTQAWEENEWRWRVDAPQHNPVRQFDRPMWDGSDPAGRKILVHPEQGFGDLIQFSRYLPMLAAANADVILEAPIELRNLLASLRCKATIIPKGVKLPDFDLHIPLMSLPRIYKTTVDSIPSDVPYLSAPAARIEKFRDLIQAHANGKRKIGLVWAGNTIPDPRRTVPFKQFFSALADVPDTAWFSLQTGEPTAELKDAPPKMHVLDLAPQLKDFADTAAAISQLDLIITIDTAAAHLAGALGAKTWTLLTAAPDWRWGWDGQESNWYLTMRLFRQQTLGDWSPALAQLRTALQDPAL